MGSILQQYLCLTLHLNGLTLNEKRMVRSSYNENQYATFKGLSNFQSDVFIIIEEA